MTDSEKLYEIFKKKINILDYLQCWMSAVS